LYFVGQTISTSGNWMQQIAVAWLVLKLTNSPFALGLATAAQQGPYLLLGAWGGLIADRLPRRRVLICTQVLQMIAPTVLGVLYVTGAVRLWMVFALSIARGTVNAIDNPARQTFVAELVGRDRLVNAVSLNASIVQAGRLLGPAVAALIIATLGLGPCFFLNALSFLGMLLVLFLMRPSEFVAGSITTAGKGQLRAGFAYAARTRALRVPLLLMAFVGLFSFNFTVVLPAVARFTFHGTATTYALLMNFLAVGALGGAIATGARIAVTPRVTAWASVGLGAALGLASMSSSLDLVLPAMIAVGAASVIFSASIQATLQLSVIPEMRGRILALYQVLYQGTTPIGAILVGWLASTSGARSGLVLGAVAAIVAGLAGLWASPHSLGVVEETLE
jgi:MFS family permease